MIVYNVTCHVDDSILDDWLEWMTGVHLPEVMETGKFLSYEMFSVDKLDPSDPGQNYAIMYRAESIEHYNRYVEEHAAALKQKTLERYGDRVAAFRTILRKM